MKRAGRRVPTEAQVLELLRTHVHIDGDCRIWAGAVRGGYPSHYWRGTRRNARHTLLALTGRPLQPRHQCWSTCGHRLCIAEDHLRSGTRRQALQAASRRGAFMRGMPKSLLIAVARGRTARLPITRAREAARMRLEGRTWREIGEHFGVSASAAHVALKRWSATGLLQWGAL